MIDTVLEKDIQARKKPMERLSELRSWPFTRQKKEPQLLQKAGLDHFRSVYAGRETVYFYLIIDPVQHHIKPNFSLFFKVLYLKYRYFLS